MKTFEILFFIEYLIFWSKPTNQPTNQNSLTLWSPESIFCCDILKHSEGTLFLFCEEKNFHVVLPLYKDVPTFLKLEPLKYWRVTVSGWYVFQSSDDPIHFLFWRENMFKSGWKRLPTNFHWNKLKTKKTCFKTSLVRSFTWIRPSTPVESIL